jgi:hypothetical protein
VNKGIDDLKKTLDRLKQREKQILKEALQAEVRLALGLRGSTVLQTAVFLLHPSSKSALLIDRCYNTLTHTHNHSLPLSHSFIRLKSSSFNFKSKEISTKSES